MKKLIIYFFILMVTGTMQVVQGSDTYDYSPIKYDRQDMTEEVRISRGGQFYDNWWRTTLDIDKPEKEQPLWKSQSTNKRSGYSTYRCKECHGWDYRGKDGAYKTGSHYTGFRGIYDASRKLSAKELEASLNGSITSGHDFSMFLNEHDISDLALFLKKGIADLTEYINTEGMANGGDMIAGKSFYSMNCMTECHGPDGTAINFGSEDKQEFIGTVANKNPWEFIHKVRAGQPGTRMSSGIINKWSDDDLRNLLVYSQTLPRELPAKGWFARMLGAIGIGDKDHISHMHRAERGFGPKTDQ